MASRQTLLGNLIDTADVSARYDNEAKKLISMTQILAWILKSCVDEFKDFDIDFIMKNCFVGTPEVNEKSVHMDMLDAPARNQFAPLMNSESPSIRESTIRYDIRFRAKAPSDGSLVELIINVEIQLDARTLMYVLNRGFYYCSRMASEQYGIDFQDDHYENLKKVASIWICPSVGKSRKNTLINVHPAVEVLYGDIDVKDKEINQFQIIVMGLTDKLDECENDIVRLMSVLLSSVLTIEARKKILEEDYGIQMTEEMEKEMDTVCNLSEYVKLETEREVNERVARDMLKDGQNVSLIEKYSKLSTETILSIANSMGMAVAQ